MKKDALINSLDTIIADCEKTIEETWDGDTHLVSILALNRLEQVISNLKTLKEQLTEKGNTL